MKHMCKQVGMHTHKLGKDHQVSLLCVHVKIYDFATHTTYEYFCMYGILWTGVKVVKQSRQNFEVGQEVKLGIGGEGGGERRNGQRLSKCSIGVVNARWPRVKGRFLVQSRGQACWSRS